jgi:O-antigen/teichoic acid export membrane protein
MAIATFGAHRLIALWVGSRADLPSAELIWVLFAWNAVVFVQLPFGYMLAGISEIRRITIYAVIGTVASATLMLALVGRWGQEGVVLGLLGGFVPFYFIGAVVQSVRVLRVEVLETQLLQKNELARQAS